MKTFRSAIVVGVIGALGGSLLPATSSALHQVPPTARLRNNGEVEQRGAPQGFCWPTHEGGAGCYIVEESPEWPELFAVNAGNRMRIRFAKRAELKRVTIDAYRHVRDDGEPTGDGVRLEKRIKPFKENGEIVAWDAIFELPQPGRHYYLNVFAYWRPGHVAYNFHARTRDS